MIWLRYSVILSMCLASYPAPPLQSPAGENTDLKIAKRNILAKEKEYLRDNPMSSELRQFIKRMKRRTKFKRELDQKHMYVVKDGGVVSVDKVNTRDVNIDVGNPEEGVIAGKYTVIPLIIPFNNGVQDTCEVNLTTPRVTTTTKGKERTASTKRAVIATTSYDEEARNPVTGKSARVSGPKREKLLNNVIKELMQFENEANLSPESALCNVSGDWDSYAGGMQIRIYPREPRIPVVVIVPREPPTEGFLTNNEWNVTAVVPYKRASLIALTAVSNKIKQLAIFIGECRVCEGAETISGNWLMQRRSKSCKDREMAHTIISDVLRKNNIRKLQHEHLVQMSSTPVNEGSENDLSNIS
ncbi:hypothetical protein JTB14_036228 [Gonioctena quinquepunctata]|nr:hypothetical protein JTB14_036228 [Gonioctena quinquepunctata]